MGRRRRGAPLCPNEYTSPSPIALPSLRPPSNASRDGARAAGAGLGRAIWTFGAAALTPPPRPTPAQQATQQYLDAHGIQTAVEGVINTTIKARPDDPFSFMVRARACASRARYKSARRTASDPDPARASRARPRAGDLPRMSPRVAVRGRLSSSLRAPLLPAPTPNPPPPATQSAQAKEILKLTPSAILAVRARAVVDSRGNPTVEADVTTHKGVFRAAVPSGASTGIHEAVELRDGGAAWMGKGVATAVANVNDKIAAAILGMDPKEQGAVDKKVRGWWRRALGGRVAAAGPCWGVCFGGARAPLKRALDAPKTAASTPTSARTPSPFQTPTPHPRPPNR